MRRALTFLGIAGFGAAAFLLGYGLAHHGHSTPPAAPAQSVVEQVRAQLASSYYRPVPGKILRLTSVKSMLAALNDPYTEYLDPLAYRLLRQETSRSYWGVGLTVVPAKDGLVVTAAQRGPATQVGVRVGDRLVGIDGVALRGMSFDSALGRIVGPDGSPVHFTVRRGAETLRFTVVRERISAPVVRARLLAVPGGRVGYVRLAGFRAGAAQVLRGELRRLERAHVSAFVLDLRENPGGLLDQAVAVASLFLDRGVVVSVESAHRHREVFSAHASAGVTRLPLVVLVDHYSASAAEIVAAALHDNRRAVLVGESTYGKGLVQTVAPLANGAALRMTTARYLTPAGVDISHRGVRPDIVAVDAPRTHQDEALAAALLALRHRT
jgi:carboxyl-terminal processing protease